MKRRIARSLTLLVWITLLLMPGSATPQGLNLTIGTDDSLKDSTRPEISPLNPAFIKYRNRAANTAAGESGGTEGGFVPSPFKRERHNPDRDALTNQVSAAALSSRYDLRDPNGDGNRTDSVLTPVRNQGSCNASWAFAIYGALESHVLQNLNATEDYSENNLKHLHDLDFGPCEGGTFDMAAAYLTRYSGPVAEADDPYSATSESACTTCKPVRYIANGLYLPARSSVSDIRFLKQAIVDHGAIATSMYYMDNYYDSAAHTYYYDNLEGGSNGANLVVDLAGWDDSMSIANAPGQGAFIVRNSRGTSWGEGGYFYVSYYDQGLAFDGSLAFDQKAASTLEFNRIYYYDPLGLTAGLGFSSETGGRYGWGANKFTARGEGKIVGVSFFATGANLDYEIYVYGGQNESEFTELLASQSGTIATPGWFTIPLETPAPVLLDQEFVVAMRFALPGSNSYPVPLEYPIRGYSSHASALQEQSYYSENGTTWSDMTSLTLRTNVCIKALQKNEVWTGGIKVNITPEAAVTNGARWRIGDGAWQESGATVDHLAPGQYTLSFEEVPLWTPPGNMQVTVTSGLTEAVTASYTSVEPAVVTVVATDPEMLEGSSTDTGTFTLTRTGPTTLPLTVNYTCPDPGVLTDRPPAVMLFQEGTLTIPAGASSLDVIVTTYDDQVPDPPRSVILNLAPGDYYTVGTPSSASVALTDNDLPVVYTSPTDFMTEGLTYTPVDSAGNFLISLNYRLETPLTVSFTLSGTARAGVDYVDIPRTATIPAGSMWVRVYITLIDDRIYEGDETIIMKLIPQKGVYSVRKGKGTATITVRDNELPPVSVITETPEISEKGGTPGTFTITRQGPVDQALTVSCTLAGKARPGRDYEPVASEVTIPAGESSAVVTITPIDDAIYEGPETVVLTLVQGTGYALGKPRSATITIVDNEQPPVVNLVATDVDVAEPRASINNGMLGVKRTGPIGQALTVHYEVSGSATPDVDYQALSGSVTIAAGERTAGIPIVALEDSVHERTETVVVTILPSDTYQIGSSGSRVVRILDND